MIDLHGHGKKYNSAYVDSILSYSAAKATKKMEISYSLCAWMNYSQDSTYMDALLVLQRIKRILYDHKFTHLAQRIATLYKLVFMDGKILKTSYITIIRQIMRR